MKTLLQVIGKELLYGSHLVSIGAVGIILSVILIFDLSLNGLILLVTYFIPLIVYTYNHFKELRYDLSSNPERVKHISSRKRWIQASPFIYTATLIISLVFTNIQTALLAFVITSAGILYTEFFKKVPLLGFKNYYTSFFWAILILIVPFFYRLDNITPYIYLVVFIFIRGIVNTIFSDIKDIEDDRSRGIKTIPVKLGKGKTLRILQLVNIFSLLPLIIGVYSQSLPAISLLLIVTVLNGLFYLGKGASMNDKKLRLLTSILIDGEYFLWPLIIILGKLFV